MMILQRAGAGAKRSGVSLPDGERTIRGGRRASLSGPYRFLIFGRAGGSAAPAIRGRRSRITLPGAGWLELHMTLKSALVIAKPIETVAKRTAAAPPRPSLSNSTAPVAAL